MFLEIVHSIKQFKKKNMNAYAFSSTFLLMKIKYLFRSKFKKSVQTVFSMIYYYFCLPFLNGKTKQKNYFYTILKEFFWESFPENLFSSINKAMSTSKDCKNNFDDNKVFVWENDSGAVWGIMLNFNCVNTLLVKIVEQKTKLDLKKTIS